MVVIVGSLQVELYSAAVFIHNLPIWLEKVREVYTNTIRKALSISMCVISIHIGQTRDESV